MEGMEAGKPNASDAVEIAAQAKVELGFLLGIEQALRSALQWMTRRRGNNYKLSTLRFHASSFERQLLRIAALADHGGYLHLITDANPHLADEVGGLRAELDALHDRLERIIVRLDHVSPDDAGGFGHICMELRGLLDDLRVHGQKESTLLQHSFSQEEGGSG